MVAVVSAGGEFMSGSEIVCLAASVVTIALAVVAIWLSVHFFHMSSAMSESTKEAAKEIGSGVDRLEKLFDRLYSDTFSMMKDTVSDMRKHIWPEEVGGGEKVGEEVEGRADEKMAALRREVDKEVGEVLRRQKVTNAKVDDIRTEMHAVVERAIAGSRRAEAEAREETLRDRIVRELGSGGPVKAGPLVHRMMRELGLEFRVVVGEVEKMGGEKVVEWEGKTLQPDSVLRLGGGSL